ncbi:MAG: beta-N-acetylhexosaminidase [Phycisphaerales bacterium]|nr:MAG: beta-N-acetylhexosaminidase [Phycisphaerales bacterium]
MTNGRPSTTTPGLGARPLWAAVIVSALGLACFAAEPPRQVLEAGTVRVVVEPWNRGVRIAVDGVSVSQGSNMVVTTPPWSPHYYLGPGGGAVRSATREPVDGGERLAMAHHGQNGSFVGHETVTVTADNRVERVLEGRFTKDEGGALIQWKIAGINPALIVGRKYKATLAGGRLHEGTVPVVAASSDVGPSTLAEGFTSIEFDSRIGPIRIDVEGEGPLVCYDYRKNRWSDPAAPFFWFGDMGTRFKKGQSIRYRVVLQLPPPRRRVLKGPTVHVRAAVNRYRDAQTYAVGDPPTIVPRPKEATYPTGGFVIDTKSGATLLALNVEEAPGSGGQPERLAAAELRAFLKQRFGVESRVSSPPTESSAPAVHFRRIPRGKRAPPEGYELDVEGGAITLRAGDARGFMHAVQTLKQLALLTADGRALVRAAQIRDWPSLRFRGVHLFTGGRGPELHEKLIRNVIAACKMNHIVLESEYIEWDSHPEIHHPDYGMPKDEVRKLLAVCNDLGIEVIPLVMSLGHCQWMFETGHNLELAEDPDAKWAYCVTNPKTYEFIYEIYQEAVELFAPRRFHIGHDEFHHRGRVPYRDSSKGYTVEQLFAMDTLRHHQWFAERGIGMMMWGDMLLGEGEGPDACHAASAEAARKLRGELPKDILIADWHYVDTEPAKFVNLDAFHADGFKTVAATWSRPGNVTHFARAAFEKGAQGLLQTTWAGYSLDPERFSAEMQQYAMYVLAAEAAWNAARPPDPQVYPYGLHFLDLMGMSALTPANRAGWTADLSRACNYPLAARDQDGWFGLGPAFDLSSVPGGPVRFKGVMFQVGRPDDPSVDSAVVLGGKLTRDPAFPAALEVSIDRRAERLAILHTVNFACRPGTKVAEYRLTYEDGEAATIDVVYGRDVFACTDLTTAADAPIVWSGTNGAGQGIALRARIWSHPHPDKVIRSLTARSANAAASLMLIGLTGLETAPAVE